MLTAVAVLASWLPARRASRVDPLVVLRAEQFDPPSLLVSRRYPFDVPNGQTNLYSPAALPRIEPGTRFASPRGTSDFCECSMTIPDQEPQPLRKPPNAPGKRPDVPMDPPLSPTLPPAPINDPAPPDQQPAIVCDETTAADD